MTERFPLQRVAQPRTQDLNVEEHERREGAFNVLCTKIGISKRTLDALLVLRASPEDMALVSSLGLNALYAQVDELIGLTTIDHIPHCQRCGEQRPTQWTIHGQWCSSCHEGWLKRPSEPSPRALQNALAQARKARQPATLSLKQWQATVKRFADRCAYCGGPWFVVEHATSISLGAGTTADNCLPACSHCNAKKGSFTLEGLIAQRAHRFDHERLKAALAWLIALGRVG